MKKEYIIPTVRTVLLRDDICLGVGSQNADPEQSAGAKKYYDFFDAMSDEEDDEY